MWWILNKLKFLLMGFLFSITFSALILFGFSKPNLRSAVLLSISSYLNKLAGKKVGDENSKNHQNEVADGGPHSEMNSSPLDSMALPSNMIVAFKEFIEKYYAREVSEAHREIPEVGEETAMEDTSRSPVADPETTYNAREWVQISGQYYRARPDHIYNVNGEKVFFVGNHEGNSESDASSVSPRSSNKESASGRIVSSSIGLRVSPQPLSQSESASPAGRSAENASEKISMPRSSEQLMETLNKAQEQIKRRNEELKSIQYDY